MASIGTVNISASIVASSVAGATTANTGSSKTLYFQTISEMMSATQAIGFAADEAIVINDVTSPAGYILIRNLDATNYVELSTATGGSFSAARFAKILPGAYMLWSPAASGAIYSKANTSACDVQVCAVDGALAATAP